MGPTERLMCRFNSLLAALFVAGTVGALLWASAIFGAQLVWWAVDGHWQPVTLASLLRPLPTLPEPWPLGWMPAAGIEIPADLVAQMWPWATRALHWLGQQAATLWLVAIATATAWISSALRIETMRLRYEATRRARAKDGEVVGDRPAVEHAAHA